MRKIFLSLCASIALAAVAPAQIEVHLQMEKTGPAPSHVAHDTVNVLISILNRSGKAVTLAGPTRGMSWLSFTLRDQDENIVSRRENAPIAAPEKLGATESMRLKVNLQKIYPLNVIGKYRVTANVYDPTTQDYESSETIPFLIDDATMLWQREIGLPSGERWNYALMKYRDFDRTTLYYRLSDAKTGFVKKTYALGDLIQFRAPKVAVDRRNQMHVLYMNAPNQYVHDLIGANGDFVKRKLYDQEGPNRPDLIQTQSGEVAIKGGVDSEARKRERADALKDLARIRGVHERPPGL